ncbi:alpha/beta hydrolase [Bacillus sp. REN3]|uniref:alpha/beta fold hydrolase n=1 Tax=Bacillus sp. REN3 TaxID=2802440 RepID=UPI001AEE6243|nr:alpha/beta hydrolase [Bacillus sp. REN3]
MNSPIRKFFLSSGLTLSYLDFGGDHEKTMLMLHGHFGNARTFSEVAIKFGDWRVVALDQRGHGWSEHPDDKDFSRDSYLEDIFSFIQNELGGKSVTLLGHSLGGVNAYQFAARYPELVDAVIVEDVGVEIQADLSFIEKLPARCESLRKLKQSLLDVGLRSVDYFLESAFEDEQGWGLRFDRAGMAVSQQKVNGDWWADWLATSCPILLIHGMKSIFLDTQQAKKMAAIRPNTQLVLFEDCGHDVHFHDLEGFCSSIKTFLGNRS